MMSASGGLTAEQKRKIEENRLKALAKRAEKLSKSPIKTSYGFNDNTSSGNRPNIGNNNVVTHASKAFNNMGQSSVSNFHNAGNERIVGNNVKPSDNTSGTGNYGNSKYNVPSSNLSKHYVKTGQSSSSIKSIPSLSHQINRHSAQRLSDQNLGNNLSTNQNRSSSSGSYRPYNGSASSTSSCSGVYKPYNSSGSSTSNASSSTSYASSSTNNASSSTQSNNNTSSSKPTSNFTGILPAKEETNKRNIFTALGKSVKGQCILISRDRFEVKVGYSQPLIELFKRMKTKMYDAVTKKWTFKLEEYELLIKEVAVLKPHVIIEQLPRAILQVFSLQLKGNNPSKEVPNADLSEVDISLVNSLLSFQREGVNFGISKNGRVLIADDMGLGKTIQALCLACYYREEWPLLIITPSSVRFDWAQQIRRWVPSVDPQEISVATTGKDTSSSQVNIVTYDLVARKATYLQDKHFQVVIADECHLLKNYKTARCKAALPILQKAHRVILLSGTPALSRPLELYTQVSAISPFMFKYQDFGVRYCDGKQQPWGWDFSGSSNMSELQLLLEEKLMIRRLKKDVLLELPSKVRQMILLDPGSIKSSKDLKKASKMMDIKNLKGMERRGALLEYFHHTGTAKIPAVRDYLADLMEADRKFLLFAHHQEFLDAMEQLAKSKLGEYYIRIDGKTSAEQRNLFCRKFQENPNIKMAILSITAANAGINLSAASLVVFGELFWNPGILVQAEDRAHRMGQQDMVNVHYLVAQNTADDQVWPLVQKKLDVLNKAGLSKDDFSSADTTRLKDSRQTDLMQYFEESFIEDDDSFLAEETDQIGGTSSKEKMTDMYSKKTGSLLNYFDCKKKSSSSSETIPSNSICQNVKSSHSSEQSVTTKGQGHVNDFPEDDLDLMMDDEDWDEADFMEPEKKKFKI